MSKKIDVSNYRTSVENIVNRQPVVDIDGFVSIPFLITNTGSVHASEGIYWLENKEAVLFEKIKVFTGYGPDAATITEVDVVAIPVDSLVNPETGEELSHHNPEYPVHIYEALIPIEEYYTFQIIGAKCESDGLHFILGKTIELPSRDLDSNSIIRNLSIYESFDKLVRTNDKKLGSSITILYDDSLDSSIAKEIINFYHPSGESLVSFMHKDDVAVKDLEGHEIFAMIESTDLSMLSISEKNVVHYIMGGVTGTITGDFVRALEELVNAVRSPDEQVEYKIFEVLTDSIEEYNKTGHHIDSSTHIETIIEIARTHDVRHALRGFIDSAKGADSTSAATYNDMQKTILENKIARECIISDAKETDLTKPNERRLSTNKGHSFVITNFSKYIETSMQVVMESLDLDFVHNMVMEIDYISSTCIFKDDNMADVIEQRLIEYFGEDRMIESPSTVNQFGKECKCVYFKIPLNKVIDFWGLL